MNATLTINTNTPRFIEYRAPSGIGYRVLERRDAPVQYGYPERLLIDPVYALPSSDGYNAMHSLASGGAVTRFAQGLKTCHVRTVIGLGVFSNH